MPTIVRTLKEADPKLWQQLYEACLSMYLDGECYAFATALHEGLGWEVAGVMRGEEIRHAVAKSPEGRFFDARGFISKSDLGKPFGISPPVLGNITIEDLPIMGESQEARQYSVARARRIAEALWPELPWEESYASRMAIFANELEALSRKHGIWMTASLPAAPPFLMVGEGDNEGGYTICAGLAGIFTMNRHFLHR